MNITIFLPMLFFLQAVYWLAGRFAARDIKGQEDYFLAGKAVRFFPLMMTFLATQVGGGVILGAAEEAYLFGWPVLLYPLGASFGLILLGAGIGRKLAGFKVSTIAEILEVSYGSAGLRKMASALSVISLFMILVAQIIASHKFLASLGFSHTGLFILFWAIVILYTAQGGLKAVISTDMVQAGFFMIIFLICFGLVFLFEPSVSLMNAPQTAGFLSVSSKLCGWLLMPLLFMVIEQDMGQRCFAGSSAKVVSRASLCAGLCTMIICVVPVFFGCLAKAIALEVPEGSSVLMEVIIKMTNPWVAALAGCAILAAVISTATSLINAISSNLSSDFEFSFLKNRDPMPFVKGMTCAISIAAIFSTFYFDNIVDILIQSYEFSVSCLFIPIIMALFKKKGNFFAALGSILFGALGFVLFRIYPLWLLPKEVASVLLSLAGFICGELLARTKTQEMVKDL